jgi:hypothetical protein
VYREVRISVIILNIILLAEQHLKDSVSGRDVCLVVWLNI